MSEIEIARAGMGIKGFLKLILILFFLTLLLAKPVAILYEQRKIEPALFELGNEFFLSTKTLANQSNKILTDGRAYDFSKGFFLGFFGVFIVYSQLISALGVSFLWLKVFSWIVRKSPFSNEANSFINYSLSFIVFYIFQIIFLISYAGIMHQLSGVTGGDNNSVAYYLLLPLYSFILFVRAIPYLLEPLGILAQKIVNLENNNQYLKPSSSVNVMVNYTNSTINIIKNSTIPLI